MEGTSSRCVGSELGIFGNDKDVVLGAAEFLEHVAYWLLGTSLSRPCRIDRRTYCNYYH